MKREIKETKKSPDTQRKPKISEVAALPKTNKIAKEKTNTALEIKAKKSAAKKVVENFPKTAVKKKTAAAISKTEKQSSPVISRKNKAQAQNSSSVPVSKSKEKNKSNIVKAKLINPKTEKKFVAEAEDKKSKSIKKAVVVKYTVEKKTPAKSVVNAGKTKTKNLRRSFRFKTKYRKRKRIYPARFKMLKHRVKRNWLPSSKVKSRKHKRPRL